MSLLFASVLHGGASVARAQGVSFEGVWRGASSRSTSVTTDQALDALEGDLYLAAISYTPSTRVIDVSGLGFTWTRVRDQCSAGLQSGVSVWQAMAGATASGVVEATLEQAPGNAVIAVSRYSGVLGLGQIVSANTNGAGESASCAKGRASQAYAVDLEVGANSVAYGAVAIRSRDHTEGADYEERAEIHTGRRGRMAGVAVEDRALASAGTVAVDGSFDKGVDWAVVGVEIASACRGDSACDDGLFCNGVETCQAGGCVAGTAVACDDGVGCTADTCDENTDACENTPDDAACDDRLFCTGAETCDPVNDCQPGTDPCPAQRCDESGLRCADCLVDAECDDGLFCSGAETCQAGVCTAGTPVACDDGVGCTFDTCEPSIDACVSTPNDTVCDDALACNGEEFCDAVLGCRDPTPCETPACTMDADCDDGLGCTVDSCDAGVCVHDDTSCAPETGQTDPDLKVAFIADSGFGSDAQAVWRLIRDEGADLILHQGDMAYSGERDADAAAWQTAWQSILGVNFPYFYSIGNHDSRAWDTSYQPFLEERIELLGVDCTPFDENENAACTYRGLFFILSGAGQRGSESAHTDFISSALAGNDAVWSVCSWHRNQEKMQIGGKSDDVGWGPYEACRDGGAIVATGHEHSYERTRTLVSTESQVVDPGFADPDILRTALGSTFVFVNGLGGRSIRDQERCLPFTFPYGCNGEWAKIYASDQGARHGALFITFHVDDDPRLARGVFKNVDGEVVDAFEIMSQVGE